MENFKKVVRIGTQEEYALRGDSTRQANIYCKIEYKDGKLSISGVIGPKIGGDCLGSCGQIDESIKPDHFAPGWNKTKLKKFLEIWGEWHLNDTCAYTPEMKAAGWHELARKEIYKYSFSITSDNRKRLADIKKRCEYAAVNEEIAKLPDEEKRLLVSENYKDVYGYEQPEPPEFMELSTDILSHDKRPKIEKKTLGWVRVTEHPDGLLGREMNGKKYGHSWYFHDVPKEALEFLYSLPETDKKPAWV